MSNTDSSSSATSPTGDASIPEIRSSPTVHHNSSSYFHTFQNFLPEALSQYRTYEDAVFGKVKDGLVVAREHPALGAGFAISAAILAMRAPRRFLFRHTFGRFQSEEARYARAEKNVKDLNQSLELMKNESKKLLERTALAEKDLKYGHNELMSTGTKCKQLAKSLYKVEARATDLMDRLREVPSREALALRADVASMISILKKQRSALDKRIMKISELGVHV